MLCISVNIYFGFLFILDEQDVSAVLPHSLNALENKQQLTVSAPETLTTTDMTTEEPTPSLPVNEIQTSEIVCIEAKSSTGSPGSSMAGSPDTESPVLVNEYVCITLVNVLFVLNVTSFSLRFGFFS